MKPNLQNVCLEITAGAATQFPDSALPQIAFSGRSNVGKSSLVNSLLRRKKLARVSSVPGKTVTVNFYRIDNALYFVDLPGYGFARRTPEDIRKWSALTDGYFTDDYANDRLKAVVQLVDLKVGVTSDDHTMLDFMNQMEIPYLIAATKCDKLSKTAAAENLAALREHPYVAPGTPVIAFSSLKGIGRDELWAQIIQCCER